jgi:hypothetical protein
MQVVGRQTLRACHLVIVGLIIVRAERQAYRDTIQHAQRRYKGVQYSSETAGLQSSTGWGHHTWLARPIEPDCRGALARAVFRTRNLESDALFRRSVKADRFLTLFGESIRGTRPYWYARRRERRRVLW